MLKQIILIGLGTSSDPLEPGDLQEYVAQVNKVYLKSTDQRLLSRLRPYTAPKELILIEPATDAEEGLCDGYRNLVQTLLAEAPVALLVPGDPLMDEGSLPLLQQAAATIDLPVTLVANTPTLPNIMTRLQITPTAGLQILDATLLATHHYPPLEPHRPILITGIYHPNLLSPLRQALQTMLAPQTIVQGVTATEVLPIPLSELPPDLSYIFIPAQPDAPGLTQFQETIAHLRAPSGCPWDRKQTHRTLRPYLLEETYEVLAAIDEGNPAELADELGDLLLQIILHAQIAADAGTFQMKDIIRNIQQKMIRRHPHVFGEIEVSGAEEVLLNWEAIKAQEKVDNGQIHSAPSAMDGVELAAPALAQALDVSKKAVKMGFEWDDAQGVLRKLHEEAEEIVEAATPADIEAEIGDFLFTAVNLARKLGVDAETALRACNQRFMRRFRQLETIARERNLRLTELDHETWFALWQQAKKDVAHLEK